jgi:hypothetical protein
MGTKNDPGDFDCYSNALPDEPMFILLARDPSAPKLVTDWALLRHEDIRNGWRPESDRRMVQDAIDCAKAMRKWRSENDGKWRTKPDDGQP